MFVAGLRILFRFEAMLTKRIQPGVLINGDKLDALLVGISDDEFPGANVMAFAEPESCSVLVVALFVQACPYDLLLGTRKLVLAGAQRVISHQITYLLSNDFHVNFVAL